MRMDFRSRFSEFPWRERRRGHHMTTAAYLCHFIIGGIHNVLGSGDIIIVNGWKRQIYELWNEALRSLTYIKQQDVCVIQRGEEVDCQNTEFIRFSIDAKVKDIVGSA